MTADLFSHYDGTIPADVALHALPALLWQPHISIIEFN